MHAIEAMTAVALDRFGGSETLQLREVPRPVPGPHEVLVRLAFAGLGQWDPFEREGGYAQMLGQPPRFPYILGSEGAGVIEAVGSRVTHVRPDDRVLAVGFLNPSGGFYAQYVAVDAQFVLPLPDAVDLATAAAGTGVGLTALRGLVDVLQLQAGETLLVHGASGGVGHIALQLAKRKGARVLAVASGRDGVALAQRLGADVVVEGRSEDMADAIHAFAPDGLHAMLLAAGADAAWLAALRPGGRVAYPTGIQPEPPTVPHVKIQRYNTDPDPTILRTFGTYLLDEPRIEVHVSRQFPLARVAEAHAALEQHHVGKMVLEIP